MSGIFNIVNCPLLNIFRPSFELSYKAVHFALGLLVLEFLFLLKNVLFIHEL